MIEKTLTAGAKPGRRGENACAAGAGNRRHRCERTATRKCRDVIAPRPPDCRHQPGIARAPGIPGRYRLPVDAVFDKPAPARRVPRLVFWSQDHCYVSSQPNVWPPQYRAAWVQRPQIDAAYTTRFMPVQINAPSAIFPVNARPVPRRCPTRVRPAHRPRSATGSPCRATSPLAGSRPRGPRAEVRQGGLRSPRPH